MLHAIVTKSFNAVAANPFTQSRTINECMTILFSPLRIDAKRRFKQGSCSWNTQNAEVSHYTLQAGIQMH